MKVWLNNKLVELPDGTLDLDSFRVRILLDGGPYCKNCPNASVCEAMIKLCRKTRKQKGVYQKPEGS
jgi:hypothetical protein